MQRGAVFGCGRGFALEIVAICLVDRYYVGKLHEALLDALQLVTGAGQHQREEEVGHVGDRGFRLADADGFNQHDIEACGLA